MIKTRDAEHLERHGIKSSHFQQRLNECLTTYPVNNFNCSLPFEFSGDTCVDIGANIGCFSIMVAQSFGKIFALEPVQQNFDLMNRNIEELKSRGSPFECLDKVKTYKLGVSDENCKDVKIYDTNEKCGDCSIYKSSRNPTVTSSSSISESIEVVNLETLFSTLNVDFIDYLKVDCEGAEFPFFYDQDVSKVGAVAMEVHGAPDECNIMTDEFVSFLCAKFRGLLVRNNLFFGVNRDFYNMHAPPDIVRKESHRAYKAMFSWNEGAHWPPTTTTITLGPGYND